MREGRIVASAVLLFIFTLPVSAGYIVQTYSPGVVYDAIFLSDMDNDGYPEIIAGNGSSENIEIWKYDSLSDSLMLVDSITGFPYRARDIGVADFDGDGDMDIASTHRFTGLYVSFNQGSSWNTTHLDNTYGWQVIIADFNKDNNLDIFDGTDLSNPRIFYGDGLGNFTADSISLDHGVTSLEGHALKVGDVNGDGVVDIVVSRQTTGYDGFEVLFKKLNDVSTESIIEPGSFVEPSDSFIPEAVYKNTGTEVDTFQVYFVIDSANYNVYSAVDTLTLGPNSTDTVQFPQFTAAGTHGVIYNVSAFTVLAGDSNSSNDTVSMKTSVFEIHNQLISNWTSSPPTIDGNIDTASGEWDSSYVYDISDVAGYVDSVPNLSGECFLYLLNDDSNLYIALDFISDTTLDPPTSVFSDGMAIFVDENNDNAWDLDSTEGFYDLFWNDHSDTLVYTSQPDSMSQDYGNPAGIFFGRTLVNHQQYEISIPMGADSILKYYLNNSGLPDTMGMLIAGLNAGATDMNIVGGIWPTEAQGSFEENPPPTVYGDVVLSANSQGIRDKKEIPKEFSLSLRNTVATSGKLIIKYTVPREVEKLTIQLFDVTGRLKNAINRKKVAPGYYSYTIEEKLTSGVYFVRMKSGTFKEVKKAIILR